MDASKFMDQMTQLTTVSGIQDLNTSFSQLADDLAPTQLIQAVNSMIAPVHPAPLNQFAPG